MARALDPAIAKVFKELDLDPKEAVWDCHGVWVAYHRALEKVAAAKGIVFDRPAVLEANGRDGVAALCVFGRLGEREEWSIGEASPKNNKNAYCWAMAEKRAKDRVILKLIGLHGDVYSETESDDFKRTLNTPAANIKQSNVSKKDWTGPLGKTELNDKLRRLNTALVNAWEEGNLDKYLNIYGSKQAKAVMEQASKDMPIEWAGEHPDDGENYRDAFERMRSELTAVDAENLMAG